MKQTITRKDGIVYERKRKSPMKYNKCLSVRLDEETYNKLKECGKPSTVIKNIIKDYDSIVECNKIMEKYFSWLVILLIFIMLAFGIDTSSRCKEVELQLQTERFEREQYESELEKEIRILKQDLMILQNNKERTK